MITTEDYRKYWWAPLLLLLAAVCYSYRHIIQALYEQWMTNEDFSHGLLVPLISLYFIWKSREALGRVSIRTDWRALPVLVFGILLFAVGELGAELFTTRVSLVVMLMGSVWLLFGRQTFWTLRFPLLFLFLMLPLPGFIYRNITFPLQILSSKFSVDLMNFFGVMAYREGNVIDVGFTQLQVVEACNGLRFIMPLFTLGVLFAFGARQALWKRVLLIAVTIPLAVGANILRIAGTGVISLFWGAKAAEGFFHSFSGWVVFMVCFAVYALFGYLLSRVPEGAKGTERGCGPEHPAAKTVRVLPVAAALILILATGWFVDVAGRVPPVPLKKSLDAFPLALDGWTGERQTMDPVMWEQVGGQSYVMIDYGRENESPVGFYTAYYEYQRKAGDFIHSPKLCLPGAGWFIDENRDREIEFPPGGASSGRTFLRFNDLLISKGDHRQLAYYWYQGRDRNFTSEYLAKFYMIFDGIFRRRTDGALVRLVRPLSPGESVEKARASLDAFALKVSGELDNYLP